jgi:CheY-like chemotaxis protein/anti-sigma regulatory factor (Ser/Thr protein kinase)
VRPTAEAKNIALHVWLDPQAGSISGDAERLQQVVWNLLTNAVKFTPEGGKVQVRLERTPSHLEITVSDSGKGIDPSFLSSVFDRFRQADQTSTRAHGGLGLGLSIVHQLVELHNGTVHAESGGEGQGATFVVQLPLSLAVSEKPLLLHSDSTAFESVTPECLPRLEHLQVLVVDDERDTRDLLRTILERCGSQVRTAASAKEAIGVLQQWKPDVLVSDIGMPQEDGCALMRKVRQLKAEDGGAIPAIALTAYVRKEDEVRALNAGFQVHLPKPIEPSALIDTVADLANAPKT